MGKEKLGKKQPEGKLLEKKWKEFFWGIFLPTFWLPVLNILAAVAIARDWRKYRQARKLRDENQREELLENVRKDIPYLMNFSSGMFHSIYALIDLKERRLGEIVKQELENELVKRYNPEYPIKKKLLEAMEILAKKLDYRSVEELFESYGKGKQEKKTREAFLEENLEKEETFTEKAWKEQQSMLRNLTLAIMIILPYTIMPLIFHRIVKKIYLKIEELKKRDEREVLYIWAKYKDHMKYKEGLRYEFSILALADLQDKQLSKIMGNNIAENSQRMPAPLVNRAIVEALHITARRQGYEAIDQWLKIEEEEKGQEDQEKTIPLTEVYLIEEEPEEARCMVTKIPLDFKKDKIVVCPRCRNFAKKEVLEQWLQEKKHCPICKKKLRLEKFPLVVIEKKIWRKREHDAKMDS